MASPVLPELPSIINYNVSNQNENVNQVSDILSSINLVSVDHIPYIPLIDPYTSFFEVSIALNVTYAASEHFRNIFSNALQNSSKTMSESFEKSIEETFDKINIMSDDDVDKQQKDKLGNKLLDILTSFDDQSTKLNNEICDANDRIADQIKPIYLFVAIINLFVLFLAGQESIHQHFPGNELVLLSITSIITILFIWALTYTSKKPSVVLVSSFAIMVILSSFFELIPLYDILELEKDNNKYIVDLMLLTAFSPFMIAFTRLFFQNLWLSIKYKFVSVFYKLEFYRIKLGTKKVEEAKNYLNDL